MFCARQRLVYRAIYISGVWISALRFAPNDDFPGPRTCFRAAFRHGVLDDDPFWIDVTVLRNYTVHTYNEQLADYVYSRLAETARRFRAVLANTEGER